MFHSLHLEALSVQALSLRLVLMLSFLKDLFKDLFIYGRGKEEEREGDKF